MNALDYDEYQMYMSIRLLFEGKNGEIGNGLEEAVDPASKINLEVDSDYVQKLLDSHNQELTIDELMEMHEQKQDMEEPVFSSIRSSKNGIFGRNVSIVHDCWEQWSRNGTASKPDSVRPCSTTERKDRHIWRSAEAHRIGQQQKFELQLAPQQNNELLEIDYFKDNSKPGVQQRIFNWHQVIAVCDASDQ
ncbi:hypothetical protein TNCV_73021 [Trichonephila clavipes]|uniref:Uncharacterized protein n=1 Tax=Trichonephila clavipes TaxID=2585209 RepID=A0A8X6V1E1_TRICX|nr:hypothetical protein TNCV_73021 [Trichonephila clavipes]